MTCSIDCIEAAGKSGSTRRSASRRARCSVIGSTAVRATTVITGQTPWE
jgi:hypothetical protein